MDFNLEEVQRIFERGRAAKQNVFREQGAFVIRPTWELAHSTNEAEIIAKAIELGWADNQVQVKKHRVQGDVFDYYIEPFEDCNCPSLLKYEDYAESRSDTAPSSEENVD